MKNVNESAHLPLPAQRGEGQKAEARWVWDRQRGCHVPAEQGSVENPRRHSPPTLFIPPIPLSLWQNLLDLKSFPALQVFTAVWFALRTGKSGEVTMTANLRQRFALTPMAVCRGLAVLTAYGFLTAHRQRGKQPRITHVRQR